MLLTNFLRRRLFRAGFFALLGLLATSAADVASAQAPAGDFRRIATFPVVLNTCDGQPASCWDTETVSEIVTVSPDGKTLIYTDAATGNIGFVDITDPANPLPGGFIPTSGEPTSVTVGKGYVLAAVNTSEDYVNTSGELLVIDIATHAVVRTIELGGQPDSVSVSPNQQHAVVVIENERNEDLCVGGTLNGQEVDDDECEDGGGELGIPGQSPAGYVTIVDLQGPRPSSWTTRKISLLGRADLYPSDPEPEFVDISYSNVAVVTLQENNAIVLIHVPTGRVLDSFSARTVDLTQIDTEEEDTISLTGSLQGIRREPDGVVWISNQEFATADEGDLVGGSRGFTIFRADGGIRYTSGNSIEHLAVRIGHYPESRSENKGTEPEGVEFGLYGSRRFLFVGTERSSFVAVYEIPPIGDPIFKQVLPGGSGPEGLLAIPSRNLFVTASENDARGDVLRSALTIYELGGTSDYPTIVSTNRSDRTPIPWSALSGLSSDPVDPNIVWTVSDSYYAEGRIYKMDVSSKPAVILDEMVVR
ncbi:MAG: alkaline phosphatase, partial [Acidobacteria bacterium]|nr:alkaline phosphatase [Acidobacteriota bacterium]